MPTPSNPLQIKETALRLVDPWNLTFGYKQLIYKTVESVSNNWFIKLNLLIGSKRTLPIITLMFWNQEFKLNLNLNLGPLPCVTLRDNDVLVQWCSRSPGVRVVVSLLTWAVIPDLRVVIFGTIAAEHHNPNWGMRMIDGCSLKLYVATHWVASSSTASQKKLNAIARFFRDGIIRMYQFTFTFYITLHPLLLALSIKH